MRQESASTEVLLVDDNPGDVRLIVESLRAASQAISLHVAGDGIEALAFLRREGIFEDAPRPDIILLDLNMPRMDGRELLALLKADKSLRTIPTVILTTSDAPDDVLTGYQLQANCYLTKPVQLDRFQGVGEEHQRILAYLGRAAPGIRAEVASVDSGH